MQNVRNLEASEKQRLALLSAAAQWPSHAALAISGMKRVACDGTMRESPT